MFPGAGSDRADADYVLVGAPLDVSTTFQPGTRFGPERIRRFARTYDDYDRRTNTRLTDCRVHDHGDIRAWDDAGEYLTYLEGVLADVRRDGALPLLLGGEHTVSVAGVRATEPDVVVSTDAHLDLREEYDGNELSHACAMRHALDVADELIVLGARTGSPAEWARAEDEDVTVVPPEAVADWDGPPADATVYLSVDIDAADPAVAPGTGTMEPFGLGARDLRSVVRTTAPAACGFDVVEVNDRDDGQAAALAGKLLREFVYTHADTTG
jgi:agmatinase